MAPRALVRLAVRGLLTHKLRSCLSILGVVFGVAAVVAMSSVGEGARQEALAQVGALGIDSITVRGRARADAPASLRLEDAESLRPVVPHLMGLAPVREAALPVDANGHSLAATIVGTTPGYAAAARLRLTSGRFLTDVDVLDRKRVAVVGASVARRLLPLGDLRGEQIRVGGDWYDVVGVLEGRAPAKGRVSPIRTRDVNASVFVPLGALDAARSAAADGIDEIVLRVDAGENVAPCAEVVRRVLRRASGGDDFDVIVPREILRQRERTQRIFNVVTGAVAAIGLVVGGIGIMNIMLASVAERTREIGIRRACGAKRRDVASQFLAESSLLTLTGGAFGAFLGIAGSTLIQRYAEWPTALSASMLVVALLMSAGVGVGFGFYPAWLAAKLQPMEALRRE